LFRARDRQGGLLSRGLVNRGLRNRTLYGPAEGAEMASPMACDADFPTAGGGN